MTGARSLVASCVYPLSKFDEGKNILTHSPAVLQSRKMTLQLLLSDHNMDCLACSRNGSCELQELCKELGVDDTTFFEGEKNEYDIDYLSLIHIFPSIYQRGNLRQARKERGSSSNHNSVR